MGADLIGSIGPIGAQTAVTVSGGNQDVSPPQLLGVFAAGDVKYDDTEGVAHTVTFESAMGWLPMYVTKLYTTATTVADASLRLGLPANLSDLRS